MKFEILYNDNDLIAINKPHGIAVHRSEYVGKDDTYVMQELRNQLGQKVFPGHRVDKKTSGVLLFSLSQESNKLVQQLFRENLIKKKYLAIVRGYTEDSGIIDYPLINDKGKKQEAVTEYNTLSRTELNIPFGKFNTSRYSLVEVYPQTGRMHQIRKHLAHINHPIIGDRPHGCNKQNKLFKEKFNMTTMMLHAMEISFIHPLTSQEVKIIANPSQEFVRTRELLNL